MSSCLSHECYSSLEPSASFISEPFNQRSLFNPSSKITQLCVHVCETFHFTTFRAASSRSSVCEFKLVSPSLSAQVLNSERLVPVFVCAARRRRPAPQVQGVHGLIQGHRGLELHPEQLWSAWRAASLEASLENRKTEYAIFLT